MATLIESAHLQPATSKESSSLVELILLTVLGGIVMAVTLGSLLINDPFYYVGGLILLGVTIALFTIKLINALIDLGERLKNRTKQ